MASLLKKVGLNTLGFVGGKLAAGVAGVLLLRALGPHDAGLYGASMGFAALFQSLSDLGIENSLARLVSREPLRASLWWSQALVLDAIQTIAVSLLLFLFLRLGGAASIPAGLVGLAYGITRLAALGMPTAAALRGLDRFDLQSLTAVMVSLLNALGLGLLLVAGAATPARALFTLLGTGALGTLLWFIAARRAGLRFAGVDAADLRAFLGYSLGFALLAVATFFYLRVDQALLAHMVPVRQLGFYAAATRVVDLLVPILGALAAPLFVQISALSPRLEAGDADALAQARASLGRAVRFMAALSLPVGIGGAVLAGPLVLWIYGPDFLAAAAPLAWLVWVAVLIGVHASLLGVIGATGRAQALARFLVLNLALNVVLNLWLIPRYGIEASAAISVLCEVLRLAFAWELCRRVGLAPGAGRALWPALPASLLMGGSLLLLGRLWGGSALDEGVPMLALVPIGALIYAFFMGVLGFVGVDERDLLKRLLRGGA